MSMELLSPAGAWESLVAAVQNGANAVYLGAHGLNARAGAGNFDPDELCRAADYAHERGVKIHVTVNTVVREEEMKLLDDVARQLAKAGVDAAIVQDFGVFSQLHQRLPSLALHASTQMAVHNRQGARLCREMGMKRVVLAREMTYGEMADCAEEGVETEAFIHGALCVACSGQCLMSSMVGGRSGNRGQCAQPCRLPWRLEGSVKADGYLLSPRDLMSLQGLHALQEAGVSSLKIEGRLKRPEYVAVVTKIYREALDLLESYGEYELDEDALEELKQIFNRGGFTRGYGPGVSDRELMYALRPNNAGVEVGRLSGGRALLHEDVEDGDALAFRGKDGSDLPVKGVAGRAGERVMVTPLPKGLAEGTPLFRMLSQAQLRLARESMNGENRKDMIAGRLTARVGQPLQLEAADGERRVVRTGDEVERAQGKPADPDRVRAQIMKTGATPYDFIDLALDMDADAFLPASALNDIRRRALEGLSEERKRDRRGCADALKAEILVKDAEPRAESTALSVQSPSLELLQKARQWGADGLVFAPEDVTSEGLEAMVPAFPIALCLPMVAPDGALEALNEWATRHKDMIRGVIAQNIGQLALAWPGEKQAGEGLNLANRSALEQMRKLGCGDYTPSVELNSAQLRQMDEGGGRRELIVYGRLALMQLRHCPIRARGAGLHADCRRCDGLPLEESVNGHALVDRKGVRFPLRRQRTPGGCVVRVMNSVPLCLVKRSGKLPPAVRWRLVLTDEGEERAEALVRLHRAILDGKDVRGSDQWRFIEETPTTTGHYFRGVE